MIILNLSQLFQAIAGISPVSTAMVKGVAISMSMGATIAAVLGVMKIGKVVYDDEIALLGGSQYTTAEKKYEEIIRIIFNGLLLVSYPAWMLLIVGFIQLLIGMSSLGGEYAKEMDNKTNKILWKNKMEIEEKEKNSVYFILEHKNDNMFSKQTIKYAEMKAEKYKKLESDPSKAFEPDPWVSSGNTWTDILNALKDVVQQLADPFESLAIAIFAGIGALVRLFVMFFAKGGWLIAILVGPLAIGTSMWWQDNISNWFKIMINGGCAMITITILDRLMYSFVTAFYAEKFSGNYTVTSEQNIIFILIISGAYLMAWKITSWWIGKPGIGQLAGKSMILGGTVIAAGIGSFMAAKGVGGQKMKDIFDTVAKATKNNTPTADD